MDERSAPPAGSSAEIDALRLILERIRSAARAMLVTQRFAWVLTALIGVCLVLGAADFVLRTPVWMRMGVWIVGVGALAWALVRLILPGLRFAPSLTEVALRVERSDVGAHAGLRGLLASGLELAEGRGAGSPGLAAPVVADAAKKAEGLRLASALSGGRTGRALGEAALATVAVLMVVGVRPDLASIGAKRVLLPWAGAEWPKRTNVADVTGLRVHALGAALPLRAALARGAEGTGADTRPRVAARYRVIDRSAGGSGASPVRRVLLTSQERQVDAGEGASGLLYERLIEPLGGDSGVGAREQSGASGSMREFELEYWFESDDDITPVSRVLLVDPPAVLSASATVTPPPYARVAGSPFQSERLVDLGAGSDERAMVSGILAGSRVEVTLNLNKPVPVPRDAASSTAEVLESWTKSVLGEEIAAALARRSDDAEPSSAKFDGGTWTLAWTLGESVRLTPRLTDEHGIGGVEEAAFRFEVAPDQPPTVTVTRPDQDRSVLASAVVEIAAEARDDVALAGVALERQRARRAQGSEGGAPEPLEDRVEFARTDRQGQDGAEAPDVRRLVVSARLDLATLDLRAGDELWITAVASDVLGAAAPGPDREAHITARSTVRKLRIMLREDLIEQVWQQLGGVRRSAVRMDEEQAAVRRETGAGQVGERQSRAQAGLSERVAREAETLERVGERLAENGLTDDTLDRVLREARAMLRRAGEQSVSAATAISESADRAEQDADTSPDGAPGREAEEARRRATEAQDSVRDELGNLIDLLDQGEDTWAVRRELERVLEQQRDLAERTGQAGERTAGRSIEQLTPQERRELEQVAQDQRDTAQRTRDAIREMQERFEALKQKDPAAADAMAEAARRGQREQVPEQMDQAAQSAQQNQTSRAQQSQQQAIQSLEAMLDAIEQGAKNRDEVLRRFLASLIESIDGLIAQQTIELGLLLRSVEEGNALRPLAPGMVRLHQNTLGVLDAAQQGPGEVAPVAALIEKAADAQAVAAGALRDEPANADEARAREEMSLARLKEAKELAEKLAREAAARESARKRGELRKAYMEALKEQVSMREAAGALIAAEPTRRSRQQARALAEDQTALRSRLADLRTQTREMNEARVFDFAHTRLDSSAEAAAKDLASGEPGALTIRRQESVERILRSLIEALDDARTENEFREDEQEEGGGGGGGGPPPPLLPPIAEIKLLRGMQIEALEMTRATAGGAAGESAEAAGRLQQDLAEQGKALLERLSRQGGGSGPSGIEPGEPERRGVEEPADEPAGPGGGG